MMHVTRYSEFLLQEDSEEIIPFSVATGDVQQLVSYFHGNGQFLEAMAMSQAACDDAFHRPHLMKTSKSSHDDTVSEADLKNYKRWGPVSVI